MVARRDQAMGTLTILDTLGLPHIEGDLSLLALITWLVLGGAVRPPSRWHSFSCITCLSGPARAGSGAGVPTPPPELLAGDQPATRSLGYQKVAPVARQTAGASPPAALRTPSPAPGAAPPPRAASTPARPPPPGRPRRGTRGSGAGRSGTAAPTRGAAPAGGPAASAPSRGTRT